MVEAENRKNGVQEGLNPNLLSLYGFRQIFLYFQRYEMEMMKFYF